MQGFESTIELEPRPSARAVQALFWVHALPLALLMFSMEPGPPLVVLALGVGASWMWLRRHPAFGYGPRALKRLTWHARGDWTLHPATGAAVDAELAGGSVAVGDLVVLNFRSVGGERHSRVLLGDELDEAPRRRLRARLRLQRGG